MGISRFIFSCDQNTVVRGDGPLNEDPLSPIIIIRLIFLRVNGIVFVAAVWGVSNGRYDQCTRLLLYVAIDMPN